MKTQKDKLVPKHIAIIMDGNRRWARQRGLSDIKGHQAGADILEEVVEEAGRLGVETVTVYALSTENLQERAKREITGLFNLLRKGYHSKLKKMMDKGVRINILGELEGLPEVIKAIIREIKRTYIKNESIQLNIALNYGGKKELIRAMKNMVKSGINVDKLNEEIVAKHLYTQGQPDPDLVIRTGGRSRLSNFLLWQTAYSELYFTQILWPDFNKRELRRTIAWYKKQKRNFGK